MYTYKAKPRNDKYELGVYDGDTIDLTIDVGFKIYIFKRIRLLGVNTPEIKGPSREQGLIFKQLTKMWIEEASHLDEWPLTIETEKSDSFGRYLANVYRIDGECLNEYLIRHGSPIYEK